MSDRKTPCPVCGRLTRRVERSGPCSYCRKALSWFEDQIDFKDDDKVHGWLKWVPADAGSPNQLMLIRES